MSRYLSENAVVKAVDRHTKDRDGFSYLDDDITCILEDVPSANVRESSKGTWKNVHRCGRLRKCSECGEIHDGRHLNFCPNCGADMRSSRN